VSNRSFLIHGRQSRLLRHRFPASPQLPTTMSGTAKPSQGSFVRSPPKERHEAKT